METTVKNKKLSVCTILFIAVTAVQMIMFIFCFAQKTSFHEDEMFHYALANSYYRPYLYGSAFKIPDNYNSWETGDSFKYYMMVNKDTAFKYDSVWYNQIIDTNPPLHYAILHTICSFFPDRFSWWWGNSLNLITFLFTQIFLYKWIKELCRSELPALLACIFYGFSIAGLNTTMFVRMYSMLTMSAVMFAYFSQRILLKERVKVKSDLIPIILVTLMGALTHHLFLIYAFAYTLIQCIYYLCRGRFRNMFGYGLAALTGVVASLVIFPATVEHMFVRQTGEMGTLDLSIQTHMLFRIAVFEIMGIEISIFKDPSVYYVIAVIVTAAVLAVPILYLFRDRLKLRERIPAALKRIPTLNYGIPIAAFAAVAYFVFIAASVDYYEFGFYTDRYIFLFFPIIIGVVIAAVYKLISFIGIKTIKRIAYCLFSVYLAMLLFIQFSYSNRKLYISQNNPDNGSISSYVEGKDCILLLTYPVNLPCYCFMLENADDIFISRTLPDFYDRQDESYRKLFDGNDEVYLLVDKHGVASESMEQQEDVIYIDNNEDRSDTDDDAPKILSEPEEFMHYFEENYGVKGEYCTSEEAPIDRFKVYLYRLTKQP